MNWSEHFQFKVAEIISNKHTLPRARERERNKLKREEKKKKRRKKEKFRDRFGFRHFNNCIRNLSIPRLNFFNFFFFFFFCHATRHVGSAVDVQSLNHWTTREVP